jgi:hypothetical protein
VANGNAHLSLPAEARDALADRARAEGVTVGRLAVEIVCAALGVDPPPRPRKTYARDAVPRLCALADVPGGVTIDAAAGALGLSRGVAATHLRKAHRGGLLTGRHAGHRGGRGPMVYRATELGRRMAGTQ